MKTGRKKSTPGQAVYTKFSYARINKMLLFEANIAIAARKRNNSKFIKRIVVYIAFLGQKAFKEDGVKGWKKAI